MSVLRGLLVLCCLMMWGTGHAANAGAGAEALVALRGASVLRCQIVRGAMAAWESGARDVTLHTTDPASALRFEAIDFGRGTAHVVENGAGLRSLHVFSSAAGLHFVEKSGLGSVVVSTVFATPGNGRFAFVMSRHVNASGRPLPSQQHGICEIGPEGRSS